MTDESSSDNYDYGPVELYTMTRWMRETFPISVFFGFVVSVCFIILGVQNGLPGFTAALVAVMVIVFLLFKFYKFSKNQKRKALEYMQRPKTS